MRFALILMMMIVLAGCQKEELTVTEAQNDESFLLDRQLTMMISSIVSHDGSFDDVVDSSSCFSIDFPYTCYYYGQPYTVNSIDDLAPFSNSDELVPEFPINITFANYVTATVNSLQEFELLKTLCADGEMYDEIINCVDFLYPVRVAIYDSETSDFETISFTHDKETFLSIEDFSPGTRANIQYPIDVVLNNKDIVSIDSNELLKTVIMNMIPLCE